MGRCSMQSHIGRLPLVRMLKTAKTKEDIPAAYQATAVETKDGWAYEDDGGLKAKNQELLEKNREINERLSAMEKALGGLKPDDIRKTVDDAKAKEEEALRKAGKFDELLAKEIAKVHEEYKPKIAKASEDALALEDMRLDRHIDAFMTKIGVATEDRETVRDIWKARKVVRLDEKGNAVAYDKDGDPVSGAADAYLGGAWKEGNKKFFDGSGSSGGSAQGGKIAAPAAARGASKVAVTDEAGFLANLDSIAKGETVVTY